MPRWPSPPGPTAPSWTTLRLALRARTIGTGCPRGLACHEYPFSTGKSVLDLSDKEKDQPPGPGLVATGASEGRGHSWRRALTMKSRPARFRYLAATLAVLGLAAPAHAILFYTFLPPNGA